MTDEPPHSPAPAPSSAPSGPPKPAPRRRIPTHVWIVAVMVVLWSAAILSRNQIRAYWWTQRLEAATSRQDRLFYFYRLASLKDRAVGPVARLLKHPDPALRSFAVAILHHASGPRAAELLASAASDTDDDVRRSALLGLALNGSPPALHALEQQLQGSDERAGMMAAAALVSAPSPAARALLRAALRASPHPGVRVEAITALEQLRDLDAVADLIAALEDQAVFAGVTESDHTAAQMLQAAQAQGLTDERTEDASLSVTKRHVVAHCAARTLRRITGYDPGFDTATPESHWDDVIAAWHAWQQQPQAPPSTVP